MAWRKEVFGTLKDGTQVDRYTLVNENGVSASFTNLGGIWLTMVVPDKDGNMEDILLAIRGVTYALAVNSGTRNNLHSGPDYYGTRLWDAQVEEGDLGTRITFSLKSPDGDQGYPGNADIAVSYTLTEDNSLRLDYHMTADADTIANFTNHAYFNMAGHSSGSVLDQQVWIDAD